MILLIPHSSNLNVLNSLMGPKMRKAAKIVPCNISFSGRHSNSNMLHYSARLQRVASRTSEKSCFSKEVSRKNSHNFLESYFKLLNICFSGVFSCCNELDGTET